MGATLIGLALLVVWASGAAGDCSNLPAIAMDDAELKALTDKIVAATAPFTLDSSELQVKADGDTSAGPFCKSFDPADPKLAHLPSQIFPGFLGKYVHSEANRGVAGRQEQFDETEGIKEMAIDRAFWYFVCQSQAMQELKTALNAKGAWTGEGEFCSGIRWTFMTFFSRSQGKAIDSNGFEHTFIGDTRPDANQVKVGGLHYWRTFCEYEKAGRIFDVARKASGDCVATLTFKWDSDENGQTAKDALKPTGSFLLGEPPEYLIAVGTLCLITRRKQDCNFHYKAGGHECDVTGKAYPYNEFPERKRCFVSSFYPSKA